jgi:hypothetical protein
MSEWTEAERSKFQEAAKQLKEYDEVSNLVYRIGEVKQEFQTLYSEIGKETGVPSVIGHNEVILHNVGLH